MQLNKIEYFPTFTHNIEKNEHSFRDQECNKQQISISFFELEQVFDIKKSKFICKLNYWITRCGKKILNDYGLWIFNTTYEWAKQLNCSVSTVKRLIYSLEEQGIILSKKVKANQGNHTKWYTINYNKLSSLLNQKNIDSKSKQIHSANKWTIPLVQNEPIIINNNRSNSTNNSSYKEHSKNLNILSNEKKEETKITSNEKVIINRMIHLWNKVFEYSSNPIKAYSNQKNQQILLKIYKIIFNKDLDKWREYVCKVNSSQFLMGEKKTKNNFKAVFSWLIKEEIIEKILNGEYGVGDRELDINNISRNIEEKKEEIVNKMDKKLSEYMKIKINDKEERERFTKYVRSASITEDDNYGILKNIIKQVPKDYILEREEYRGIKENIYESYVMKKYLGYTKLDIREKMRERIKKIDEITGVEEKIKVLKEIEKKLKHCVENNLQNDEKIGNYNSRLLKSILLSNPKKELRYLKDSLGMS